MPVDAVTMPLVEVWVHYPVPALLIAGLIGAIFGSFISLISYRIPREESVTIERSRCPSCSTPLNVPDLVPVFSWLWYRGHCRHCDAPIGWRYVIIEIATAGVFAGLFALHGPTLETLLLWLLAIGIITLIVTDFEFYIIPDSVQLLLLLTAIIWQWQIQGDLLGMLQGAGAGAAIGLGMRYGYQLLRGREGLGLGDVKFLVVVGAWLGLMPLVPFLFLSGIIGVLTAIMWRVLGHGEKFPFGPALAISLFICVLFPEISDLYWNLPAALRD